MRKNYIYTFLGLIIVAGYAVADFSGWEFRKAAKTMAPQSMRGAHASRSFWYSGFRGGK
jgi:hypothetical protein